MPRIAIDLPERFTFSTALEIYQSHINEAGHVDNALLLTLVSEARQRFFRSLGYSQLAIEGVGIVVSDAAVQYLAEAFHGETLSVEMTASDFNKYGCDLVYRIKVNGGDKEIARGKTGIVFFDYNARKVAPVPAPFRDKVLGVEG